MRAKDLVRTLFQSDFVKNEIPMQLEMGLPYLRKTARGLCINFQPHAEELVNGVIRFYPPQYEIEWVYPFRHVVYFRNLALDTNADLEEPAGEINEEELLSMGLYYTKKLYRALDEVLEFLDETGQVTDTALQAYQREYSHVVNALGLKKLYYKE